MDRSEIEQHVLDALGKILVDKSLIQEKDNAALSELVLDEEDYARLFAELSTDFNIVPTPQTVSDISHLPEHPELSQMTLIELVDKIYVEANKLSEKRSQDTHR